ncbi:FGGY-family carbohydrate kinase [Alicyclobacillus sp. SO9]|uniref:xylulokinase n=1 Tax=Alicyclobacillus sp. SO9 TaxID=2665646 RepID=UPI0018E8B1DC|nr:FGGY family carbohydrate kinase [Alicyclobacillus sp. SO9]QQE77924.1 hypothetical protein GI364_18710 [Alicyclobacillus sp. SO9]
MKECILTIDLGTTSCKVMAFSPVGAVLGQSSAGYPTWRPDGQRAEQHSDDWWEAATYAVRQVVGKLKKSFDAVTVRAISLSSQRESIVPVDANLRPIHPAILWMDTRGVEEVRQLQREFGEHLQRWTGLIPNATYSAGKLLWLQRERPDVMKSAKWFVQAKDYLFYRMSGILATDYSLASRTLLFDIRTLKWRTELLDACGITAQMLPEVYPSTVEPGTLQRAVAEEWGLDTGIPIVLGGGDRACEVLGSGIQDNEMMESSGTTSNIACAVSRPIAELSSSIACSVHVVPDYWLLEQGLSTTGAVFDWWIGQLEATSIPEFSQSIEATPPGSNGVIALPFFMGARAPRWNPDLRGSLLGLSLGHTSADIGRAILEGIGFELRYALNNYEALGVTSQRVRLIGGGTRISTWNQIKADIYKRFIAVPKVVQAASFGTFLLAAKRLQWISSYEEGQRLNPANAIYHPDLNLTQLYDDGYELYLSLSRELEKLSTGFQNYRMAAQQHQGINYT